MAAIILGAALLHWRFCEWRVIEYEADRADEYEARAIWRVRRVLHPSGNAPAWDARKAELRAYHGDWLACWVAETSAPPSGPDPSPCRARLDSDADLDATTRAVELAACEEEHAIAISRQPTFCDCLARRGHAECRRPRWTRDDFGPRFAGPYVMLFALFAEDWGGAARSRALGWAFGVALPLALVAAALAAHSSTWAPSSTTRFGGTRK